MFLLFFCPFQNVFARLQEFENGASDTFFFLPECFPCCSAGPPNHSSCAVLVSHNWCKLALASDLKISVWVSCMLSFSKATVLPRNNSKFLRLCIHVQFMHTIPHVHHAGCATSEYTKVCLVVFVHVQVIVFGHNGMDLTFSLKCLHSQRLGKFSYSTFYFLILLALHRVPNPTVRPLSVAELCIAQVSVYYMHYSCTFVSSYV